jgi:hypothetical protein
LDRPSALLAEELRHVDLDRVEGLGTDDIPDATRRDREIPVWVV